MILGHAVYLAPRNMRQRDVDESIWCLLPALEWEEHLKSTGILRNATQAIALGFFEHEVTDLISKFLLWTDETGIVYSVLKN
jgi:hypothetical protein